MSEMTRNFVLVNFKKLKNAENFLAAILENQTVTEKQKLNAQNLVILQMAELLSAMCELEYTKENIKFINELE